MHLTLNDQFWFYQDQILQIASFAILGQHADFHQCNNQYYCFVKKGIKTGNFWITRELLLHVSHVVSCLSNSVLRRQYLLRWTAYCIILFKRNEVIFKRNEVILLTAFTKPKFEIIDNRSIVVKSVQLRWNFYFTNHNPTMLRAPASQQATHQQSGRAAHGRAQYLWRDDFWVTVEFKKEQWVYKQLRVAWLGCAVQ